MAKKPKAESPHSIPFHPSFKDTDPLGDDRSRTYTGNAFTGTAFIGDIPFDTTKWTMNFSTKSSEEAAMIEAVRQLETWRARGYHPQLRSTSAGWLAQIDAEDGNLITLRFNSNYQPTFIAAVQKAMEVIK